MTEEATTAPLEMSDAEFMEQDHSALLAEDTPAEAEDNNEDVAASDQTEEVSEAQEQTESTTDNEEVSQPTGDTQEEHEPSDDGDVTESLDTSKKDSTDTTEDTQDTTEFNYKSAYKKVMEPFKANGVDMQVKDPNEIVRLMQMGANYQKKMAQIKPSLKIIKMLENNQLLDEAKLNNLIDISKMDKKAIAKLVKESGLDPLDIDTDVNVDYQPTDYSVKDKEYNLDQVLEEIKGTETFSKTIDVLTKEWDDPSKTIISDNPQFISIINDHMANGTFDIVNAVMQRDKALGKLVGLSDVAAYQQIAEHMWNEGKLVMPDGKKTGATKQVSGEAEAKKLETAERDERKKAVAPVKHTSTKKVETEDNFLGLSDEDFMKKHG